MSDVHILRQQILEDEYSFLNEEQKQAVFCTEGPLLILAGAGSGKTTVIVNRISYLIRYGNAYNCDREETGDAEFLKKCLEDRSLRAGDEYLRRMGATGVDPHNILAITFTNKAAGEMKSRLEDNFGIDGKSLWALTFHSFCVRLLRQYCDRLGYDREFTIYDDHDTHKLLDSIIKHRRVSDKYTPKTMQNIISRAKINYETPKELYSDEISKLYPKATKIYEEYQRELMKANAMDFDDLIFMTVRLLEENPDIRERVNNRFKYILVDEYQDTNPLQFRLVSILASHGNICVVGDDDQSIYRFMGAVVENILGFDKNFAGTRVVRLEKNYRSTQTILDAANNVISHNENRMGKNMWTDNGTGEKIVFNHLSTQNEEADYIAKEILEGVSAGEKYNSYCVLFRTNAQSSAIEMSLKGNGIPYRVYGGLPFFRRKEIQDILSYMNVINNPKDQTRLLRIINEPRRGIGLTTISRLEEISEETGKSIFDIMRESPNNPDLLRVSDKLTKFSDTITELADDAPTSLVSDIFNEIIEKTGYKEYIKTLGEKEEAESRLQNLDELFNNIKQFEATAEKPTLSSYLEQTALISAIDNLDENEGAVTLMTMHCAKGLEFDRVFISGFEEGVFPSQMSTREDGGVEEERRLCYVAMTRARKKLYITAVRSRLLYGSLHPTAVSRFKDEIPADLMEEIQHIIYEKPKTQHVSKTTVTERPILKSAVNAMPKKQDTNEHVAYDVGTRVKHKAFGEGTITGVKKMASDSLIEVTFDNNSVGVKKLMANYAKLEIIK